jgi:cell division septation protein DedD
LLYVFGALFPGRTQVLKKIALGTTVLFLGGCALPVPLQIASWALDGISVIMTEKSVTDHGISIIAQKDCAVWRGVVDGELCRDNIDEDVMVAEGDTDNTLSTGFAAAPSALKPVSVLPETLTVTNQQVIAERRQAGVTFSHAMSNTAVQPEPRLDAPVQTALLTKTVKPARINLPQPELDVQPATLVKWSPPAQPEFIDQSPEKGIYFVIGSFRNLGNAERLSKRYRNLSATLISAKLDGRKIYRVVVGPVQDSKIKFTHKVLRKEGLGDTWAIRVNPADWTISARSPQKKPKIPEQLARLSE